MYYPKLQDVESIIKRMNKRHNMNVVIINKGQLEFALAKPQMQLFGTDQYPNLYQKAAVLMETLTKSHTLSDGNKRTAMMTAEFMIKANGGDLVLPLKAIRLSVETAMDETDSMSELIQKWFYLHTAMNPNQFCFMVRENIEEESWIKTLWEKQKFSEVEEMLAKWMSFDSYPESKKAWDELLKQWKDENEKIIKKNTEPQKDKNWSKIWHSIASVVQQSEPHESLAGEIEKIEDLWYNDNTIEELDKMEHIFKEKEYEYETTNDPEILLQNGIILKTYKRDLEKALNVFKKAYESSTNKLDILLRMGLAYQELGKYDKSIDCWDEYLKINPEAILVMYMAASTLALLKKHDKALEYIEKIPQEKIRDDILLSKAICMKYTKKTNKALEILEDLIKRDSENITINVNLAVLYMDKKEFEKALNRINKVIEIKPNDHRGQYKKALILRGLKRHEEEIELYDKVIEIKPDHYEALINKGVALSSLGKYEEALEYFKNGLAIEPKNPIITINIGMALADLKRYEEALEYFNQTLKIEPHNAKALLGKSAISAKTGEILECLSNLEKAVKEDPKLKEYLKSDPDKYFENVKDSERFKKLIS